MARAKPVAKAKTAAGAKPAAPGKLAGKAKPAARKAAAGKAKPSTRQKPGGWGRAEGKPKFRAAPRPVAEAEAPPKPVPVIPAELLDDGPKVKKPRKPRGKKADAPKPVGALDVILQQLDDSKAQQVVTISLEEKKAVADAMVVASGTSNRHVGAIADQLVQKLKERGYRDLRIEGMPQCDWVLVDAGDVVVHIFRPEVRSFYNLEKLWSAHAPDDQWAV